MTNLICASRENSFFLGSFINISREEFATVEDKCLTGNTAISLKIHNMFNLSCRFVDRRGKFNAAELWSELRKDELPTEIPIEFSAIIVSKLISFFPIGKRVWKTFAPPPTKDKLCEEAIYGFDYVGSGHRMTPNRQ